VFINSQCLQNIQQLCVGWYVNVVKTFSVHLNITLSTYLVGAKLSRFCSA